MFFKKRESTRERVTAIEHPTIGMVTVKFAGPRNRIKIVVKPKNNIILNLPNNISLTEGIKFLDQKAEWVNNAIKRQNIKHQNNIFYIEDGSRISTLFGSISFKIADGLNHTNKPYKIYKTTQLNNQIEYLIEITKNTPITTTEALIVKILQIEAKVILKNRVEYYSNLLNLKYNKLFFKNNKTNWGSCSSANNINLNIHLLRIPQQLCDYVILHELCHLEIKNHGPLFHNKLNSLCNHREKELSKALKKYSTAITIEYK